MKSIILPLAFTMILLSASVCSAQGIQESQNNRISKTLPSESSVVFYADQDLFVSSKTGETQLSRNGMKLKNARLNNSAHIVFNKDEIAGDVQISDKMVFFHGLDSPHDNLWVYLERARIGSEYNLWVYDELEGGKFLLFTHNTGPVADHAFRPIAWGDSRGVIYLEAIEFDSPHQHEGIWEFNIGTGQSKRLPVSNKYMSTPIISPDRRSFAFTATLSAAKEAVHGISDKLLVFDIQQEKETVIAERPGENLFLAGWVRGSISQSDLLRMDETDRSTPPPSNRFLQPNFKLPWTSGLTYCVSRHGTPAPTGGAGTYAYYCGAPYNTWPQHTYKAIDFDTPNGVLDYVRASAAGTVTFVRTVDQGGYGKYVIVTHSDNTRTLYAHLNAVYVSVNDAVQQGCPLGDGGTTGNSTGDHIHFEYQAAGGAYLIYPIFDECGCTPLQAYAYTSANPGGTCTSVPSCQCGASGNQWPSSTLNPTSSWQTQTQIWGGDYTLFNVVSGVTYEWSYCSSDGGSTGWDTEMALYRNSNLQYITCDDDFCGVASGSKISWAATFTGVARIKTTQYNCQTNSTNATLAYRSIGGCSNPGIPTPVSPGTTSGPGSVVTTTTPTFTWNTASGATDYDIFISKSPYGSSNLVYTTYCLTGTSHTIPAGTLQDGFLYRWNMQANVSCTACEGGYSSVLYFQVDLCNASVAATSASANPPSVCSGSSSTLSRSGGSLGTGASWEWYAGSCGGTYVGSGSSVSVSPTSTTTYYVRAEGTCGTTSCRSVTVNVNTSSISATSASANPPSVCSGSSSTLSRSGGSLGTGASWEWYAGSCGGTYIGSGSSVSVSPTSTTTYYVRAEGTCNVTGCVSVPVTINPSPVSQFFTSQTVISQGDCIDFTNLSSGNPTSYSWTFDGASPGGSSVVHPTNICYNTAGSWSVSLVASNACGNHTSSQTGYITVTPPACTAVPLIATDNITPNSARLNWVPAPGAHHYQIRGRDVLSANWHYINIGPGQPPFFTPTGLRNYTTYLWQILTWCDSAETIASPWSMADTFTTGCQQIANAWTGPVSSTSATLNWSAVVGAIGYEIVLRKTSTFDYWGHLIVPGGGTTSTIANLLDPATEYEWSIRTICDTVGRKKSGYLPLMTFTTASGSRLTETGQQPSEERSDLHLFPNPANNQLYINLKLDKPSTVRLRIANTLGQVVSDLKWDDPDRQFVKAIPITGLQVGIYYIYLDSDGGFYHGRFFKE